MNIYICITIIYLIVILLEFTGSLWSSNRNLFLFTKTLLLSFVIDGDRVQK
jgi:hypothetical protein